MKSIIRQGGFTIVETLIVLAVVGVISVSIMVLLSGRIQVSRQNNALSSFESKLRLVLQDVANGSYQSNNLSCSVSGLGSLVVSASNGLAYGQGGNTTTPCDYAGKQITFNNNNFTIDTLATLESNPLTPPTTAIVPGEQVVYRYENQMSLKTVPSPSTFLILNTTNYPTSNTSVLQPGKFFTTGQQQIGFFKTPIHTPPIPLDTTGIKLCLNNGKLTSSITINQDNTISSKTTDASC